MRKSERTKQKKRPYSPSELASPICPKKTKVRDQLSKSDTHTARGYDLDPYGRKFECWRCGSNYIINPTKKKQKKRSQKPSPRYLKNADEGIVMLCNACGLKEKRPKKRHHSHSADNSRQHNEWIELEKKKYLQECQEFTFMLSDQLDDRDAEKLYCPYFNTRQCGCVQRYIIGKDEKGLSGDQQSRAQGLLELVRSARELGVLRHWEEGMDSGKDDSANRQSSPKPMKRGLGNGQKKSLVFLDFILEKRAYLRDQLNFCEKGCQKILGYSNNLLYRKLKTEDNQPRIKVMHGDRDKLCSIDDLVRERCCTDHCSAIAKSYPGILQEWRYRASVNKTECRRVIAEMATPYAASFQNCNRFIRLVTGSSLVTIGKVRRQIFATGGEREPPEHGLKRYWEQKQQAQQNTLSNREEEEEGKRAEPEQCTISESETKGREIDLRDCKNKCTESVQTGGKDTYNDTKQCKEQESLTKKRTVSDPVWSVLPNLLVKRALLIQEQKALVHKQGTLKSKQDLVEKDLIKVLQHQGEVRKRTRRRSGQGIIGETGSSLSSLGFKGQGQCGVIGSSEKDYGDGNGSKDNISNVEEYYGCQSSGESRSTVGFVNADKRSKGIFVTNVSFGCSDAEKGGTPGSELVLDSMISSSVEFKDKGDMEKTTGMACVQPSFKMSLLTQGESLLKSLDRSDNGQLDNTKQTTKLSETVTKTLEFSSQLREAICNKGERIPSLSEGATAQISGSFNTSQGSCYVTESSYGERNSTFDRVSKDQTESQHRLHISPGRSGLSDRTSSNHTESSIGQNTVDSIPQYYAYADPSISTQVIPDVVSTNIQVVPSVSATGNSPYVQPVKVLGSVNTLSNSQLADTNRCLLLQLVNVDTSPTSAVQLSRQGGEVSEPTLTETKPKHSTAQSSIKVSCTNYSSLMGMSSDSNILQVPYRALNSSKSVKTVTAMNLLPSKTTSKVVVNDFPVSGNSMSSQTQTQVLPSEQMYQLHLGNDMDVWL